MAFELTSKSFELTEAIKAHAEKVTGKLAKLHTEVTLNHMILRKEGVNYVAEYEIKVREGNFFAKDQNADCYVAMSGAVQKVFDQLKKKQDKFNS